MQVSRFSFYLPTVLTAALDLKLGNVLVKAHAEAEEIDDFLRRHPAQTYPSPSGGQLPPEYVPTVRTEPLPLPKLGPSFEKLEVCITDYGTGTF